MMQRREFLKWLGLVSAGIVAADQVELLDRLAPRRLFPSGSVLSGGISKATFPAWNEVRPVTTVGELQAVYRRTTTKLYKTLTRVTPEYEWFGRVPTADMFAAERSIPLILHRAVA